MRVVAANTDGTLVKSRLDMPEVMSYLARNNVKDKLAENPEVKYVFKLIEDATLAGDIPEPEYELIHPIVPEFIGAIKNSGIDFVICAGASTKTLKGIYEKLGIDDIIDGYYSFAGRSRSEDNTFVQIKSEIEADDYSDPVYFTDKLDHSRRSELVWGKGLLSDKSKYFEEIRMARTGNLYAFDWDELTPGEIDRIIGFLLE